MALDPLDPVDMAVLAKAMENDKRSNEPDGCGMLIAALLFCIPPLFELIMISKGVFSLFHDKFITFTSSLDWEESAWIALGVLALTYIWVHYLAMTKSLVRYVLYFLTLFMWTVATNKSASYEYYGLAKINHWTSNQEHLYLFLYALGWGLFAVFVRWSCINVLRWAFNKN